MKSQTISIILFANRLKATLLILFLNCIVFQVEAQVKIVVKGESQAIIVTSGNPTKTVNYAVKELVKHIKLATGVILDVVPESKTPVDVHTRIYIGVTLESQKQGIDVNRLPRESFVMRSVENDLFILGFESDGEPLDPMNPNCGTLFGVYEFLENYVGVRWLWPGELGTYVPRTKSILVSSVRQIEAPALLFRGMRNWGYNIPENSRDAQLGFSPDIARNYHNELKVLYRRHRLGGQDIKPPTGHNTIDWNVHGKEHPNWFVLNRNGKRGNLKPESKNPQISLCVTNEELQDYIVEEYWDGKSTLVLGPEDAPGRCICDKCRAWDGSQPKTPPWFATMMYEDGRGDVFYGQTSDRYARFWKVIREKAVKRNPDVLVSVSFLYENEFTAPITGVKLDNNFFGQFVQWQDPHLRYFPMPNDAFDWIKEQWIGWQNTGIRMAYRPNYLHDGYVMPHFETWQSGNFFKFAYEHGMEGTDFDMNTGQWAVQGLRLFMHLRLHSNPELEIDSIRQEYFDAFGSASKSIERYFNYWEHYATTNTLNFINNMEVRRYAKYPLEVQKAYPLNVFIPAVEILDQALKESQSDTNSEFAERVKFLQVGLEHARLTIKLATIHNGNKNIPKNQIDNAREVLTDLVKFRKTYEHLFFSDLYHVTHFWEGRNWNMDYFTKL